MRSDGCERFGIPPIPRLSVIVAMGRRKGLIALVMPGVDSAIKTLRRCARGYEKPMINALDGDIGLEPKMVNMIDHLVNPHSWRRNESEFLLNCLHATWHAQTVETL